MTNALKHAQATLVRIELTFEPEEVRLSVQDNGRGFDPAAVTGDGFGLTGMRERAERLGGRVTISSRPGQGTEVVLVAPASPGTPIGETK
jgi:signal transduction histidine kinase